MPEKERKLEKLEKIATLKPGWDGEDALALSPQTTEICKSIIKSLKSQPQIAPTGRGTILLQFLAETGSTLDIEVGDKKAEAVLVPKDNFSLAKTYVCRGDVEGKVEKLVEMFFESF